MNATPVWMVCSRITPMPPAPPVSISAVRSALPELLPPRPVHVSHPNKKTWKMGPIKFITTSSITFTSPPLSIDPAVRWIVMMIWKRTTVSRIAETPAVMKLRPTIYSKIKRIFTIKMKATASRNHHQPLLKTHPHPP